MVQTIREENVASDLGEVLTALFWLKSLPAGLSISLFISFSLSRPPPRIPLWHYLALFFKAFSNSPFSQTDCQTLSLTFEVFAALFIHSLSYSHSLTHSLAGLFLRFLFVLWRSTLSFHFCSLNSTSIITTNSGPQALRLLSLTFHQHLL